MRQHFGETRIDDFVLSGLDVVFDAADGDVLICRIVDRVSGMPVAISRLAGAADVDEIFSRWTFIPSTGSTVSPFM